jgi:hypothetical protein
MVTVNRLGLPNALLGAVRNLDHLERIIAGPLTRFLDEIKYQVIAQATKCFRN